MPSGEVVACDRVKFALAMQNRNVGLLRGKSVRELCIPYSSRFKLTM